MTVEYFKPDLNAIAEAINPLGYELAPDYGLPWRAVGAEGDWSYAVLIRPAPLGGKSQADGANLSAELLRAARKVAVRRAMLDNTEQAEVKAINANTAAHSAYHDARNELNELIGKVTP